MVLLHVQGSYGHVTHTSGWLEVAESALYGLCGEDEMVELGAAYGGERDLGHVPIVHIAYTHHVHAHQLLHLSPVPVPIVVERSTAGLTQRKTR